MGLGTLAGNSGRRARAPSARSRSKERLGCARLMNVGALSCCPGRPTGSSRQAVVQAHSSTAGQVGFGSGSTTVEAIKGRAIRAVSDLPTLWSWRSHAFHRGGLAGLSESRRRPRGRSGLARESGLPGPGGLGVGVSRPALRAAVRWALARLSHRRCAGWQAEDRQPSRVCRLRSARAMSVGRESSRDPLGAAAT
jgi:hypothetical protein